MYYSLIYPFLIYALPVYGTADSTHLNKIYILQKKVVRLMTFSDPLSHSLPLFKELEILTISEVFKMETSKFVFESLNHINPSQFHDFFIYPSIVRNTRNFCNNNLFKPHARTKHYGLNSIKNNGAHIWNNIPLYQIIKIKENVYYSTEIFFHLNILIIITNITMHISSAYFLFLILASNQM